jgi:hypothetical protein
MSNKKRSHARSAFAIVGHAVMMMGIGTYSAEATTKPESPDATTVIHGPTGVLPLIATPNSSKSGTNNTVSTLTVVYSPAGCYGQTDWPHYPHPYMSDHGRTRCASMVQKVTAQTTLLRSRWYGWQTVLVGTTASRVNNTYSGDSSPHWRCDQGTWYRYKGQTSHTSLEGGTTYSAITSSENSTEIFCGLVL